MVFKFWLVVFMVNEKLRFKDGRPVEVFTEKLKQLLVQALLFYSNCMFVVLVDQMSLKSLGEIKTFPPLLL